MDTETRKAIEERRAEFQGIADRTTIPEVRARRLEDIEICDLAIEALDSRAKLKACMEAAQPIIDCLDKPMSVRYVTHEMLRNLKAALEQVRGK